MEYFKGQDYHQLKSQHLKHGVKFTDDTFTLKDMNIFSVDSTYLQLKRPIELVERPRICAIDSLFSLKQGFVQNFNVLIGLICLKYYAQLWNQVFLGHKVQDWNGDSPDNHSGLFCITLWEEGHFVSVTVDDLLPCSNNMFVCTASSSQTEFWPALVEKAYAKLLGGYHNLESVRLEEVLMDLTGGVTECISLQRLRISSPMKRVEFFEKLQFLLKEGAIVLLSTDFECANTEKLDTMDDTQDADKFCITFGAPGPPNLERDISTGLCKRYGYLLTRTCVVPKDVSAFGAFKDLFRRADDCPIQTRLLRLRCPLTLAGGGGGLGEWTGAYSSYSSEWDELPLDARQRLNLTFDSESDFWIPFDAVSQHMTGVVVCHLPNTDLVSFTERTWQLNQFHGAWHGHQTGGSIRFRDTFLNNPQYAIDILTDSDEVLISLIIKRERDPVTCEIQPMPEANLSIGMGLFQIEKNRTTRVHRMAFMRTLYVEASRPYRVSFMRRKLNVGRYVLIPFLEEPLSTSAYLLRMFLPKRSKSWELTLDIPPAPALQLFASRPREAVRMHVYSAESLQWIDGKNPPNPYCIIYSENSPVSTVARTGTSNPVWDETFLFYRRQPHTVPLVIQIMHKRAFGLDVFLGRHTFKAEEVGKRMQQEFLLFGKDNKNERFQRMKGSLYVEFFSVSSNEFMQI